MPWSINHYNHRTVDGPQTDSSFLITTFTPENLSFTLNKAENGPHEITYEVSRSSGIANPDFIGPYRTDFELWSPDSTPVLVMAGPHTLLNITSRQEHAKCGGKDWTHLWEFEYWPFDPANWSSNRLGIPVTDSFHPPYGYSYHVTSREVMSIISDILGY